MDPFNETMSKPADWAPEEIDKIVDQIQTMIDAGRPDMAIDTLGFLVSQNQAIVGATSDDMMAAYLEKQTADSLTLYEALQDKDTIPDDFLSALAARFGITEQAEYEPEAIGVDSALVP